MMNERRRARWGRVRVRGQLVFVSGFAAVFGLAQLLGRSLVHFTSDGPISWSHTLWLTAALTFAGFLLANWIWRSNEREWLRSTSAGERSSIPGAPTTLP